MIKHILKTIWNERKINAWILLELIIVFCILWFCTDYMVYTLKGLFEPKGFDIDHTYVVNISIKDEGRNILSSGNEEEKQQIVDDIWAIYDRIGNYPAVEAVCFSNSSFPYINSYSSMGTQIDSVNVQFRLKRVTPEFFDVFQIKIIHGTPFSWDNIVTGKPVIISADASNMIGGKLPEEVKNVGVGDSPNSVIGVAERNKRIDYEPYEIIMYQPIKRGSASVAMYRDINIRVKPDADRNLVEQFTKDMRNQLQVGYYYFSGIEPLSKYRQSFIEDYGYGSNFKSIYSITAFLIVNIFLGIIGTFWFRIQSRRSEIGLRLALGSTKTGLKGIFMSETFMLLFLASIIATIISVNISVGDIVSSLNVPVPERGDDAVTILEHAINYGFTFFFLFIIAIIAVWYPARKASKIAPAEALRDE